MSNSKLRKIANDGLQVFISGFPEDSGNMKYNATTLRNFYLTRDGAKWTYNLSGRKANYAEAQNEGYEQWIFGKNTHKRNLNNVGFVERSVGRYVRWLSAQSKFQKYAKSSLAQSKSLNNKQFEENFRRKLVQNKSIEVYDNGKITPTQPKKWEV